MSHVTQSNMYVKRLWLITNYIRQQMIHDVHKRAAQTSPPSVHRREENNQSVWRHEDVVTFLTLIHKTNQNVIFPSCFPTLFFHCLRFEWFFQ